MPSSRLLGFDSTQTGSMEEANHGTLVLDEIGDLDLEAQTQLLNALEEKRFYRAGNGEPLLFDLRFLAITSQDLEEKIAKGTVAHEDVGEGREWRQAFLDRCIERGEADGRAKGGAIEHFIKEDDDGKRWEPRESMTLTDALVAGSDPMFSISTSTVTLSPALAEL